MLGNTAFIIAAFIVVISIIVAIHEYGHYIVGRWCGIHAETFSIGFGKVLFSRVDKRGTRWQVAALPFGGYVKFLGDANAASYGSEEVAPEVNPRNTMHGAPLWARAATIIAGPLFNFILAIAIFAGTLMYQGRPSDPVVFEAEYNLPPQFQSELQPGDQIIAAGDIVFGAEDAGVDELPVTDRVDYTVVRDGEEIVVQGPYPVPPRLAGVNPRSAADDAGMKVDDVITAINGEEIRAFADIVTYVNAADGDALDLTVWRDGETIDISLAPRRSDLPLAEGGFETRWLIGISGTEFFQAAREPIGLWDAIVSGTQELWWRITTNLSGLWHVFSGSISTCNISGPVAIAQASGTMAEQGPANYILFIGVLSAAVGLLNLLPIPILDGGHLVFHAYEAVFRRKPNDKVMQGLMVVGISMIATLMIFALLNDTILCP
ncbi:regulator of sigma E protease [Cognatiyoonia koreensis]|uniref:Zinc metalloprotease n=2 Tax=Cognatiyoonia koreensis TaxID=364200 RepID=A0A1I0P1K7_9RHOB|nr:RIP metalloprotease RseP [Cognatiyoonia koreensis]SEW07934.1 regulator of sigma E protease [Cognatiyoonia koreensis]